MWSWAYWYRCDEGRVVARGAVRPPHPPARNSIATTIAAPRPHRGRYQRALPLKLCPARFNQRPPQESRPLSRHTTSWRQTLAVSIIVCAIAFVTTTASRADAPKTKLEPFTQQIPDTLVKFQMVPIAVKPIEPGP